MTDINRALERAHGILQQELERPSGKLEVSRPHSGDEAILDPQRVLDAAEEIRELQLVQLLLRKVRDQRALLSQLELEDPEAWLALRGRLVEQCVSVFRNDIDYGIESAREERLIRKAFIVGYNQGARTP